MSAGGLTCESDSRERLPHDALAAAEPRGLEVEYLAANFGDDKAPPAPAG